MSHSVLAPSSASVWGTCPGSVLMELMYPEDTTSEASLEGTWAHGVAMDIIGERSGRPSGRKYTNIPMDMYEGAELYANSVVTVMRDTRVFGGAHLGIERPVQCHRIHPECSGIPDTYLYDERNKVLYIWDFKYGRGLVEVFENKQLITYAAGVIETLGLEAFGSGVKVVFTITQPRAYHRDGSVRDWVVDASALSPYIDALSLAAHAALGDDPQCVPGSHCKYCRGRHACPAAQAAAMWAADFAREPTPDGLTPNALGLEAALLEDAEAAIKNRLVGIRTEIESLMRGGASVPGWALSPANTHRRWLGTPEDLAAIGVPTKPVTPAQAEAAGVNAEIVATYTEKPRGAMKLKRDNGSRARMIFGEPANTGETRGK